MKRRTLIRLLVGVGIGVPVLVELLTLAGMLDRGLFTGGDGSTPTPTPERVAPGDEFLPETAASEILTGAEFRAGDDRWMLTLTVTVQNAGQRPYELRLAGVELRDGRTVSGGVTTGQLAPGEETSITGEWRLPAGATPDRLLVVTVVGEDTPATTETAVPLANIPVQGS